MAIATGSRNKAVKQFQLKFAPRLSSSRDNYQGHARCSRIRRRALAAPSVCLLARPVHNRTQHPLSRGRPFTRRGQGWASPDQPFPQPSTSALAQARLCRVHNIPTSQPASPSCAASGRAPLPWLRCLTGTAAVRKPTIVPPPSAMQCGALPSGLHLQPPAPGACISLHHHGAGGRTRNGPASRLTAARSH